VDGNGEDRSDTVSVFNGPLPTVHALKTESEETALVSNWIGERAKAGVLPHEFGYSSDRRRNWIVHALP